ncbi:MAG: hypothetical protein K0U74_08220 [Alphaproteobacteria bacterium]|nr:hypothetical protein [Alphaproteobacteria bacterium]
MFKYVRPAVRCVNLAVIAAILCVSVSAAHTPAAAHHAYVTKYDAKKLVRLRGVISSVNYRNPHIFFDLTVTNKDGSTTTWTIETESIAKATAKGLRESRLKIGAKATVTGWRARSGYAELGMKSITTGGRTYAIRRSPR